MAVVRIRARAVTPAQVYADPTTEDSIVMWVHLNIGPGLPSRGPRAEWQRIGVWRKRRR